MKKICIIAFTDNGIKTAGQIKNILEAYSIDVSANSLKNHLSINHILAMSTILLIYLIRTATKKLM